MFIFIEKFYFLDILICTKILRFSFIIIDINEILKKNKKKLFTFFL